MAARDGEAVVARSPMLVARKESSVLRWSAGGQVARYNEAPSFLSRFGPSIGRLARGQTRRNTKQGSRVHDTAGGKRVSRLIAPN